VHFCDLTQRKILILLLLLGANMLYRNVGT